MDRKRGLLSGAGIHHGAKEGIAYPSKLGSKGSDPKSLAGRPEDPGELLGQVFTPEDVAARMVELLLPRERSAAVRVLDPAVGPATFPRALLRSRRLRASDQLFAFDVDPAMVKQTRSFLRTTPWRSTVAKKDYLEAEGGPYDLAIMNPPYVRQEWLDKKTEYQRLFADRYGVWVPGTSNLYVYFLVKVLAELKAQGKLVSIVYDSWMYTKFGEWLAGLMRANCDEFDIVSVGAQPFESRLIDATIIVARRSSASWASQLADVNAGYVGRTTPFTAMPGFKAVDDLFVTKRGLRLKQAAFFLSDLRDCERLDATPFVKKPAKINGYVVPANHSEAALLVYPSVVLSSRTLAEIQRRLALAQAEPDRNVAVLTWYAERPENWFVHRRPPHAPLLFNYYLRSRPRHLYNPTRAYADNFYGLKPKNDVDPIVLLSLLNSTAVCTEILLRSRNQGSGLAKIQLYEYRRAMIPDWSRLSTRATSQLRGFGQQLVDSPRSADTLIARIDQIIYHEFDRDELHPCRVKQLLQDAFDRAGNVGKR